MAEIQERLRITGEFRTDEHEHLRKLLFGRLERRLEHWRPEQVDLELSVKERDTDQQRVVLVGRIAGVPTLVATSTESDLDQAVVEVRDDLRRQVNRHVTKQEGARTR